MTGGPGAAGGVLLLGRAPLNTPVPGLCTNLYTDAVLPVVTFVTSSAGTASTLPMLVGYDPSWTGPFVTAQAVALDGTQPGLPIAATQGVRCEVPPPLPAVNGARAWALGSPTAPSGNSARTSWLVTQFR
jgi:hypothetical protein